MRARRLATATALLALPISLVRGQDPGTAPETARLDELRDLVSAQTELIGRLESRIEELEARLRAVEAEGAAANEGAGQAPGATQTTADPAAGDSDGLPELSETERREQERLVRAAFQGTLIDRGGLLLPSGTIEMQPSVSFTHSSADNIVIDGFTVLPVLVVGDIVSERIKRDLSQASTEFRFGLPWASQLDVRLPYGYQRQRSFSADGEETTNSASGTGDVEIGFSREVARSRGVRPDLIASLRWKAATGEGPFDVEDEGPSLGTGYESLNLALTGVKVIDPIVYFGSLSYTRNSPTDEADGRFDPGDMLGLSMGMAIALNLNSSVSFSFDHQRVHRSRIDDAGVPGSYLTTSMFSVGGSLAISDTLTADFSLGIGLTADSPDLRVGASFPLRLRR